jgi:chloride channel protein, CIC family
MRELSPQPNLTAAAAEPPFHLRFWCSLVVAGAVAGIATGILMLVLNAIQHLAWPFGAHDTLLEAIQRASPARRVLSLSIAGIWIGLGGLVLRRVYQPGISLESSIWLRGGRVPTIATISRAVLSLVGVGLGMSLGREAAAKQTAGALASGLSERFGLHPSHRQVLVACGVGAGMAAAYNVPFGGAIFAAEVLLGSLSARLLLPAILMSAIATLVSWLILPTGPIYSVQATHLSAATTAWAIIIGPVLGVVAAVFIKAVAWAGSIRLRGLAAVLAPMLTLTLLGVLAISAPQLLGNGQDSVQLAFNGQFGIGQLSILPGLKAIAALGCLACGARGGLFTPTMMIGATLGGLLGFIWAKVWPGADLASSAMIGSGALLAATTQGPTSAVVMFLELTRHGDAVMVPMLLAVAGATLTAARLDGRSIYSARSVGVDGESSSHPPPTALLPAREIEPQPISLHAKQLESEVLES